MALLDEAAAPGRIPILSQAISYLPGYNVRVLLVIQAYSQLREIYGLNNADTMMKSLAARILYAPKDFAEANEISQELGMTTVKVKSRSKPVFNLADMKAKRSHSVTVNEHKRPLMLPQEIKELGRDRELILYEGLRPILAKKNRYFEDRLFRKRLLPPPTRTTPARSPQPPGPLAPAAVTVPPAQMPVTSSSDARVVRDSTVADIERIDTLTLEDFDVTLPSANLPERDEGEPQTREELDADVAGFLKAFDR